MLIRTLYWATSHLPYFVAVLYQLSVLRDHVDGISIYHQNSFHVRASYLTCNCWGSGGKMSTSIGVIKIGKVYQKMQIT